jgi:phospholipid transport system transporter-binding protein
MATTMPLRLPERITLREARSVLDTLAAALTAQPGGAAAVEVDASALAQFDSSALGVLVDLHRRAAVTGRACRLIGMPSRLTELARLYGVSELVARGTQGAA